MKLASFDEVLKAIDGLPERAGLGWALAHCAQSIEYSISGYPSQKSAFFKKTLGALVLGRFLKKGELSHDVTAAIPGAPELPRDTPVAEGARRLTAAIARFRAHPGPYAPHFAYGPVDRARYEAVQSHHVANHLSS